jgi:hypothetical protein
MSSNDSTYNGWTNKPTWLVHLWLTNDYVLYHTARDVLAGASDPEAALQDFVDETYCDAAYENAGLIADLLGWAGDRELARSG